MAPRRGRVVFTRAANPDRPRARPSRHAGLKTATLAAAANALLTRTYDAPYTVPQLA